MRHRHIASTIVIVAAVAAGTLFGADAGAARAASGNELVNVTLNIPADVRENPCNAEFVALSGRLHIVYYVRSDSQGGYHLTDQVDEQAGGTGLTSGASYVASDTATDSWYARPPFPQVFTSTHSIELVSNGTAPNFLFLYDLHTTVNAAGTPTASVDHFRTACTG